jgi:hypothetical protein
MLRDGMAANDGTIQVISRRHTAENSLCALEVPKWRETASQTALQAKAAPMTASAMEVRTFIRCMSARILTSPTSLFR